MPFLRFSRDKRGYETTSLVHAARRHGRARQHILYWFRTPPGVKVGRPALDEEAIRWIEEHNPDIQFDWQKILQAKPPAAAPVEDGKRRPRRERSERKRPPDARARSSAPPARPQAESVPPARVAEVAESIEPIAVFEAEPEALPIPAIEDAIEQLTHGEQFELQPPAAAPEQVLGREQLTRLRARYAELQARITERGGEPERIEALRTQAEALNPDSWVTEEEAKKGVEEFEARIRDLRAALGLRRRRRSRRGGRGRRRGYTEGEVPS